jgi:hypothetical protein
VYSPPFPQDVHAAVPSNQVTKDAFPLSLLRASLCRLQVTEDRSGRGLRLFHHIPRRRVRLQLARLCSYTYGAHGGCAYRLQRRFCSTRKRAAKVQIPSFLLDPRRDAHFCRMTHGQNDKRHTRSYDKAPPPRCPSVYASHDQEAVSSALNFDTVCPPACHFAQTIVSRKKRTKTN